MLRKYRVLNPKNIDKGVRLIRYDKTKRDWYEGDEFIKPAGMPAETVEWLLDQGLIVQVIGGCRG